MRGGFDKRGIDFLELVLRADTKGVGGEHLRTPSLQILKSGSQVVVGVIPSRLRHPAAAALVVAVPKRRRALFARRLDGEVEEYARSGRIALLNSQPAQQYVGR